MAGLLKKLNKTLSVIFFVHIDEFAELQIEQGNKFAFLFQRIPILLASLDQFSLLLNRFFEHHSGIVHFFALFGGGCLILIHLQPILDPY